MALLIHAGPRAMAWLAERGLRAQDVRAIPAAAGGAKGITLNPLDRFIFGQWLQGPGSQAGQTVHLLGASIGAWRMAAACLQHEGGADAALAQLAEDYITQRYEHAPGKMPTAATVSRAFGEKIEERLGVRAAEVLSHPRFRLHVFTSRGRHVLARQGRVRTPAGYLGAFLANVAHRQALGAFIDRVVFSDGREPLPFALNDFRTQQAALTPANLAPAVLASCSIPFWLNAVQHIPGGPRGAYWDGGITDYHLHLDYAGMREGIVLYPHFQPHIVPGWLDKPLKRRHRASPMLDNLVVLSPRPEWVAALPNGKLPDRNDFKAYGDDEAGRVRDWRIAVAESQRLADEFAEIVTAGRPVRALPLP